jgi:hypothetical protein
LYAVSFTAEIMPCFSVDSPSPIHAESAATVGAAILSESRIGRQAAPAIDAEARIVEESEAWPK